MNRIAILEPQCRGLQHVPFNAALLQTTRLAFPEAGVTFAAEREHGAAVREFLGSSVDGVDFCSPIEPTTSGLFAGVRFAREASRWSRGFDLLVLASTTPPLNAAMGWMRCRRVPMVSIFHACIAELRFPLVTQVLRNPLCMHTVARLPVARYSQNVVLGASILENLRGMGLCRRGWASVDHPVLDIQAAPLPTGPMRFALLSGFERANAAVEQTLERVCGRTGASWVRVGRDAPDAPPIGAAEYRRRLQSAHCAVWWADPDGYRLRASATFLDAIGVGRPVVYRGNDFIDAYQISRGPVGVRVTGPDELEATLTRMAEAPSTECERLAASAAAAASSFRCERVAPVWREIVGVAQRWKSRSPIGNGAA